jgi:uncharacterized protein YcfL
MKLPLLASLLIASIAAAGCGGSKVERADVSYGCPSAGKKISSKEDLIKAKVEIAGSLPNIDVVDLRCTDRAGLLRIDADLKNDGREERRIAYRFRWLDKDGMRATEDESWKPLLIYGKTLYTVTTTAPSADATDFRFVIMDQDK